MRKRLCPFCGGRLSREPDAIACSVCPPPLVIERDELGVVDPIFSGDVDIADKRLVFMSWAELECRLYGRNDEQDDESTDE